MTTFAQNFFGEVVVEAGLGVRSWSCLSGMLQTQRPMLLLSEESWLGWLTAKKQ